MKLAVVGSRGIHNREFVYDKIDSYIRLVRDGPVCILSGGAKGVDTLAYEYCDDHSIDFILFKPYHLIDNKVEYNPRYFFTRNKQIADNADLVLCFWDGQSSGTRHMIEYCQRHNKRHKVIEVPNE